MSCLATGKQTWWQPFHSFANSIGMKNVLMCETWAPKGHRADAWGRTLLWSPAVPGYEIPWYSMRMVCAGMRSDCGTNCYTHVGNLGQCVSGFCWFFIVITIGHLWFVDYYRENFCYLANITDASEYINIEGAGYKCFHKGYQTGRHWDVYTFHEGN